MPQLVLYVFNLFKSEQSSLISVVVRIMKEKSRIGFESLMLLLDNVNIKSADFLKFIPVFIIPVIQSIQYSRAIFGDDKQITQILA